MSPASTHYTNSKNFKLPNLLSEQKTPPVRYAVKSFDDDGNIVSWKVITSKELTELHPMDIVEAYELGRQVSLKVSIV